MCYICERETVFEIYGKCVDSLSKREKENGSLKHLVDLDYIHSAINYKEFTSEQIDYLEAKWSLSLITRFRYRTNVFNTKKDIVCDKHKGLARKLIERNIIIVKNGEEFKIRDSSFL
jgi:hypothetical protein